MIAAAQFVEAARARGFDRYAGVPCSYLTPFINYVLQDPTLHYVSAANEGDAVALIAGVALGGRRGISMMQNSGLGNAVSPLTSLTWTFRLPQLLIVTWRGQPSVPDEPQHALMGPITPAMLDTMEIPWELFPTDPDMVEAALDRAVAQMDRSGRPYALLMQKGSVAPYPLMAGAGQVAHRESVAVRVQDDLAATRPTRHDALEAVIAASPLATTVVIASTGYCGRELHAIDDRPNQLYMVGSMGCVTSLALGLALVRRDLQVIAVDGDGAALMRMSAFATLGSYGPANLLHVLLDNAVHDSTGGQATVSPNVSFAAIAAACGYASADECTDLDGFATSLAIASSDRTRFVTLAIAPGAPHDLPRPTMMPIDVMKRLMRHIDAGTETY